MTTSERPTSDAWKLVPVEPTEELLRSMAVRFDHGLGVPGYYDQPIFGVENVGHAKRMESTMSTMRQLHEEVVGTGFYRPAASAPASPAIGVQAVTDEMVEAAMKAFAIVAHDLTPTEYDEDRAEVTSSNPKGLELSIRAMRAALESALHPAPEAASAGEAGVVEAVACGDPAGAAETKPFQL